MKKKTASRRVKRSIQQLPKKALRIAAERQDFFDEVLIEAGRLLKQAEIAPAPIARRMKADEPRPELTFLTALTLAAIIVGGILTALGVYTTYSRISSRSTEFGGTGSRAEIQVETKATTAKVEAGDKSVSFIAVPSTMSDGLIRVRANEEVMIAGNALGADEVRLMIKSGENEGQLAVSEVAADGSFEMKIKFSSDDRGQLVITALKDGSEIARSEAKEIITE